MHRHEVEELLQSSIGRLIKEHHRLIGSPAAGSAVHEIAIAVQLAWILRTDPRLDDRWDVDVEYNRDGLRSKRSENRLRRPDIILHRRQQHGRENNLLVLELKKDCNDVNERSGGSPGSLYELRAKYKYQYGVFLCLGESGNKDAQPRWGWTTDEETLPDSPDGYDLVFSQEELNSLLAQGRDYERTRYGA